MTDEQREQLIEAWRVVGTYEPHRNCKEIAFARMRELIEQRSPEQVAQMEVEKGLGR